MASVTVLCPNARRCPIKITPGTLLRGVLQEACLKQGYDVETHDLVYQKKRVDLSLPFRLSGLPNNVTLELTPSDRDTLISVEIALQMPDGSRKLMTFSQNLSLFDILTAFSREFNSELTDESDQTVPSCAYMNKQYRGCEELKRTTLRSIGITTGRSLIRFQKVAVSGETLKAIEEKLENDRRQKEALAKEFERKRAENEERERTELERMQRFEEEQRRRAEEEERARGEAEIERVAETRAEEPPSVPAARDRLPSPPRQSADEWSFDRPVFSQPVEPSNPRLAHLQSLLRDVDNSLSGRQSNANNLVEQLAERGRVPVTQLGQRSDDYPLRNFKFPDAPASTSVVDDSAMEVDRSEEEGNFASSPSDRKVVTFEKRSANGSGSGTTVTGAGPSASVQGQAGPGQEVDESFFDVNVDDLKSMQRALSEEVKKQQLKALLPQSYIEKKNRVKKMEAYQHSVVRFVLSDRRIIQANFNTAEPASAIPSAFSSLLASPVPFELSLALHCPLDVSPTKNLVDVGIAPSSTVYVKFRKQIDDLDKVFKLDEVNQVSSEEAELLSKEWLSANGTYTPWSGTVADEARTVTNKRAANACGADQAAPRRPPPQLPKWLKK